MDIGSAIRSTRKLRGLKQKELAEFCKISPGFLSQIESNQRDFNLSTLENISQHLNVPLPILFFMALEESDIPIQKKDVFRIISPVFRNLLNDVWMNDESNSTQNS